MVELSDYSFNTDKVIYSVVDLKGEREHFVTGHISVSEIDSDNDFITSNCLKSMLEQIKAKSIKLDYEHEAWRDSPNILPVGKITDARIDGKGLWVKCKLNKHSPKFKALWGSVKGGFVNAFSIAFKPLKTVMKTVGDAQVRLIDNLELLNVAMTGVPVNKGATIDDFGMKSVFLKAIVELEKFEEKYVVIEKSKLEGMEMPEEEVKVEETVVAEVVADKKDEVVAETKSFEAEIKSLKDSIETQKKILDAQAVEIKSLKEAPVLKSVAPVEKAQEVKVENQASVFDSIQ